MSAETPAYIPYCGSPPLPNEIWSRWNLDPVLIVALIAILAAYVVGVRAAGRDRVVLRPWERICFYAGWAIASLALVSPLCSLSVALFSARVSQHMILALVAAPLIMLGRPALAIGSLRPVRQPATRNQQSMLTRIGGSAVFAWASFAAFLWFWHAPGPYDATFTSDAAYWSMHLTVFGSALLLWRSLLQPRATGRLKAILSGLTTSIHMGLLGAIVTFAPNPLYAIHANTTVSWGLTQLEDQQLGGVIMWVPGCSVFLIAGLLTMAAWLRAMEKAPRPA